MTQATVTCAISQIPHRFANMAGNLATRVTPNRVICVPLCERSDGCRLPDLN